jgi:hypothetical protein
MIKKAKAKPKNKVSFSQNKALQRNWSKGIIVGTLKNFTKMREFKAMSIREQLKLANAKKLLEEILTDWKPTL